MPRTAAQEEQWQFCGGFKCWGPDESPDRASRGWGHEGPCTTRTDRLTLFLLMFDVAFISLLLCLFFLFALLCCSSPSSHIICSCPSCSLLLLLHHALFVCLHPSCVKSRIYGACCCPFNFPFPPFSFLFFFLFLPPLLLLLCFAAPRQSCCSYQSMWPMKPPHTTCTDRV